MTLIYTAQEFKENFITILILSGYTMIGSILLARFIDYKAKKKEVV